MNPKKVMSEPSEWLVSDEIRELTQAGSSVLQIAALKRLGIPFDLDPYETPLVKRSVGETYKQQMVASDLNKVN